MPAHGGSRPRSVRDEFVACRRGLPRHATSAVPALRRGPLRQLGREDSSGAGTQFTPTASPSRPHLVHRGTGLTRQQAERGYTSPALCANPRAFAHPRLPSCGQRARVSVGGPRCVVRCRLLRAWPKHTFIRPAASLKHANPASCDGLATRSALVCHTSLASETAPGAWGCIPFFVIPACFVLLLGQARQPPLPQAVRMYVVRRVWYERASAASPVTVTASARAGDRPHLPR